MRESVEAFLERERRQLPPWFVVGFGTGVAAWFMLDRPRASAAFLCVSAALALIGFALPRAETAAARIGQHPWAADVPADDPKRMRYRREQPKRGERYAPIRDRT